MTPRFLAGLLDRLSPERRLKLHHRLRRLRHPVWLGSLRRTTPISDNWGFDRGLPVDRYYIERFLAEHRRDIRGRVLEIKDSGYTERFGVGVERRDVLDIDPANPRATIIADLRAVQRPVDAERFDCFLLTQTLQFIYDIGGAVAGARRLLRDGGVLLATVPAVSRIAPGHEPVTDYWRLTPASASALFGAAFGAEHVEVRSYGNVLAAIAFLTGMAVEELSPGELDVRDAEMPVLVAVRAVRR
jgi:hypothetical protein